MGLGRIRIRKQEGKEFESGITMMSINQLLLLLLVLVLGKAGDGLGCYSDIPYNS